MLYAVFLNVLPDYGHLPDTLSSHSIHKNGRLLRSLHNRLPAIASSQGAERKDYVDEVKNAGFDIIHIAKEMEEYYIEKAEK